MTHNRYHCPWHWHSPVQGGARRFIRDSDSPTASNARDKTMKIICACGQLIHDGTDALPHKAHLIPDQAVARSF